MSSPFETKIDTKFIVGRAQSSELPEIVSLVNSGYRGESSRAGWTTEADFLSGQRTDADTLELSLKKPGKVVLTLREATSSPILGCVMLERFQNKRGVGCYLGMLTVRPTLQAQGLGKQLLAHAEDFARQELQATHMLLGVIHLRDSLIHYYERRGYRSTGVTEPFPYGDPKAGIPLRSDLHFVMFEKTLV